MSILKIDSEKGEIIVMGKTEDVNRAASLFGCKVRKSPICYQVLPLGVPYKHCGS